MNESGLGIILHHEVPNRRMIGKNKVLDPSRYGRNFSKANTTAKNSFSVVV